MKVILTTGLGRSEKQDVPLKLAEKLEQESEIFKWQDLVEIDGDPLISKHTSYGTRSAKKLRKLLFEYAYDETSYCDHKYKIFEKLKGVLDKSPEDEDITLIAHSLGTVIFYDYLKEIGDARVKKLITFGCPIPLLKGEMYNSLNGVKWINYWENSDPLAHKLIRHGIQDRDFHSKHWLKGWNPLAHMTYFKSRWLSKEIIKELAE